MLWWLIKRTEDGVGLHETHQRCGRCGLYYIKKLAECDHCSSLSDTGLNKALAQRKKFRMSFGKAMLIGALIIVVALIVAAFRMA